MFGEELTDLLRRAADKTGRVEEGVELGAVERHLRIIRNQREERIGASLLEHRRRRHASVEPQALVHRLPVTAAPHRLHQDRLGGHQRQLFRKIARDHRGKDLEAIGDVVNDSENRIGGEEGLRQSQAAVGRVVEGPLEPLAGSRLRGVGSDGDQPSGKGSHPLRAHWIGLVGHG